MTQVLSANETNINHMHVQNELVSYIFSRVGFTANECSFLITPFLQWKLYWELEKPVLVQKSPQDMLKIPFLKQLFRDAKSLKFIVVIKVCRFSSL